jgi:hypothetical protein
MKKDTISAKRIIVCLACGCAVREDLLDAHASRCTGKIGAPEKRKRTKTPRVTGSIRCPLCSLRVPAPHYAEHRERCEARQSRRSQADTHAQPPRIRHDRTDDGYQIDRCWDCGRRICLVPDGNGSYRVYEITPARYAGEVHMCNGQKAESRRTILTYVNPRLGSIAPRKDKRGLR